MKTILFAIAMEGLSPSNCDQFEKMTMTALRSGSREYADSVSVHCDYKEGINKMCQQYRPDWMIVNEALPGSGDIYEIIKDLKSDYPEMNFTVLMREHRGVGDVVLANLTAAGIFNWASAPWKPDLIANTLISPKKRKDVEMYIPKIVEGSNGLAFDVREVEKTAGKLDDLDIDVLSSGLNNAVKTGAIVGDINEKQEEEKRTNYTRILGRGFGFGNKFKPVFKEDVEETPVQEIKEEKVVDNLEENNREDFGFEAPKQEEKPVEENKKERKMSLLEAIKAARAATEAEQTKTEEKPQSDEFSLDSPVVKEEPIKEEEVKKEVVEEKPKENKQEKKLDDRFAGLVSRLDNINIEKKEQEKPVAEKKAEPIAEKVVEEKKEELTVTLSSIKFEPKFKKILFVRAMPISSVVPAHVAKLMNASFVDFNKTSNNEEYFENFMRTTIKEANMPEAEFVVGDVVAGNGIEKVVEKFDHVIALLPEDYFAIKAFMEKYEPIINGAVIDKCTTSSLTRKQLVSFVPKGKYIDTIKVDNCNKEVVQSAITHDFLMDNPEFAEGMHYFLKDIGGVEWI